MRGVETDSHTERGKTARDSRYFFQARTDRGTHSSSIFDQDAQLAELHPADCLFDAIYDGGDGRLDFSFAPRARVNDEKIGAQRACAHQLIVKSLNRASTQHRLDAGKIDQIIRVNDQRTKSQLVAARAESRSIGFWNSPWTPGPHSWACRKDLQGVATEFSRGLERVLVASGNGSMNSDAQASVNRLLSYVNPLFYPTCEVSQNGGLRTGARPGRGI